MKTPWRMTAKAADTLEIFLYDEIGDSGWGDGTTARQFAQDLKDAGAVQNIVLRVNSPGGSVFDGITIHNTLVAHSAKIRAQIDGLAASIASCIIMAASEISMCENSLMMIHNPHTITSGDSNDLRKIADTMDKVKGSMILAYQRHTKMNAEEISALMDEEFWMTATEACDKGFAESILQADAVPLAAIDISKFKSVPAAIAARLQRPAPEVDIEGVRRRQRDRIELMRRL